MNEWADDDSEWHARRPDASLDRRREQRIALRFPIEVSGLDQREQFFSEKTATDDISEHGCRFKIKAGVHPNLVVKVRLTSAASEPASRASVEYKIARVEKAEDGLIVGAAKLGAGNLWCVSFPEMKRAKIQV
jgi:hypothetical protein